MDSGFEYGTDGPQVIVVGLDGSPTSLRAAAYAAGLARRQGSELIVLYAMNTSPMVSLAPSAMVAVDESLTEMAEELRALVESQAVRSGIRVTFRAVHGDPFHVITRQAMDVRADAVVVGASTRIGHRLAGSLAVRLVRAGKWPVTVVP